MALSVFTACGYCADEGAAEGAPPFMLKVEDAPISEVLTLLSEASGVSILVGQDITGTIESIYLRNVTVEDALRQIATVCGLYWVKDKDTYLVTAREIKGGMSGAPVEAGASAPVAVAAPAVPSGIARPSQGVGVAGGAPSVPAAATAADRLAATAPVPAAVAPRAPLSPVKPVSATGPAVPAVARAAGAGARPSGAVTGAAMPAVPAAARSTRGTEAGFSAAVPALGSAARPAAPGGAVPGGAPAAGQVPVAAPAVPPGLGSRTPAIGEVAPGAKTEEIAAAAPAPRPAEESGESAFAQIPMVPGSADVASEVEGGDTLVASATGIERKSDLQWLPIKYANPADIALLLGGTVSYASSMRPEGQDVGRRARSASAELDRVISGGSGRSGADRNWMQDVGRGLSGGGGGFSSGGYGSRGGGRGGGGYGGSSRSGRGGGQYGGQGGQGGGFRPEDVDYIVAYMPQNALLVSGDPAAIDQLRENLAFLDQPVKQVEIATKFIQVDVTEDSALGIDWLVSNGSLEFFNLGFAPGEAVNNVVRWSRGSFEATLGVVQNMNKGTIINEPRVTTENNVPAYISFYTTIPYFTANITYNQFGQREVEFEEDEVDVEQTLEVTPRINGDDTITMYLTPIMEDQTGVVQGPNGEELPIVASQEIETQVTVPDGETIVLGGMIRKQTRYNTRSTPLLSEIPIIGKLFTSKSENTQDSELLIFVTPKIVRDLPAP